MKIAEVVQVVGRGQYLGSDDWEQMRKRVDKAIERVEWPCGSGSFTIYPESGKKRGQGNGVKPIKTSFLADLKAQDWVLEGAAESGGAHAFGNFDALTGAPGCKVALEWETGNISSSHRSLNKMALFLMDGLLAGGILIVPSSALAPYLTDRIGNIRELRPYIPFWEKSLRCLDECILEIIVVEHDRESCDVPRIPKATDGRAQG